MAEYIEREALLAAYDAAHKGEPGGARKLMVDAPAADVVAVVHGRWVWDENAMDWGLGGWICSKCQEKNDNIPAKPDIHPSGWVGSHYCPNCGARMEVRDG